MIKNLLKLILIAATVIVSAPIIYFFGWYYLDARGAFCDAPSRQSMTPQNVQSVRFHGKLWRSLPTSTEIIQNPNMIYGLIEFLEARKAYWRGIGPNTPSTAENSVSFETRAASVSTVWFTSDNLETDNLFLSIGFCTQTVPSTEAQPFYQLLQTTEASFQ